MDTLLVRETDGLLHVALNRPDKRNAFFPGMIAEITATFERAAKLPGLRAVVLTGEGASFCAGGDLQWMKSMAAYSRQENLEDADKLFAMFKVIYDCPVPVVGRVFGHCFGGGAGLVAVCDMVTAEMHTQFSFSEVKWGLVPAVISPFVFDRVPARARIVEWFTTAKVFTAPEALGAGLINHVGGSLAEIDGYIAETLHLLRAAAPGAVRETKRLIRSYSAINFSTLRPRVTALIAERRVSEEGQQGLGAFLAKTNPPWSTANNEPSAKSSSKN